MSGRDEGFFKNQPSHPGGSCSPPDEIAETDERIQIMKLINSEVLAMKYPRPLIYKMLFEDGLTQQEAGRVLRLSQPTIAVHKAAIMRRLQDAISKTFPDESKNLIKGIIPDVITINDER